MREEHTVTKVKVVLTPFITNEELIISMTGRLRDFIPQFSFTGVKAVLVEKFTIFESNTEVQTTDLQETIERQSTPVVKSREKEIESKEGRGTSVDFIYLQLENHGEGVAQNLYVRPSLVVNYDPNPDEGISIDIEDACFLTPTGDGFEIIPRYFPLIRTEGNHLLDGSWEGGVLSPNDGQVKFAAQVEFEEVFHEENGRTDVRSTVSDTTRRLYDAGIRDISFQLHVLYTDVNDNVHTEQVVGKPGELTESVTLEEISEFRFSSESSDYKLHRRVEDTFKYPP